MHFLRERERQVERQQDECKREQESESERVNLIFENSRLIMAISSIDQKMNFALVADRSIDRRATIRSSTRP